jgi:hypothetical protein
MSVIRDQRSPPLGPTGATDIVCQNKFTSDGEASTFEVVHEFSGGARTRSTHLVPRRRG